MGSWDTCHGPWRDDQTELLAALEAARKALAEAENMLSQEKQLLCGPGSFNRRVPVPKDQLELAIRAATEGARPGSLPRQDPYPYAKSLSRSEIN